MWVIAQPANADRTIDARGKTIIPGFVDMHAHHFREHRGYRPLRDYESAAYLAYGVTTNLDNSMWSQNIFPTAELIESGRMIGPRAFSSGDPLYRGDAARQNSLSSFEVTDQNVKAFAIVGCGFDKTVHAAPSSTAAMGIALRSRTRPHGNR